jgi:TonB family protein
MNIPEEFGNYLLLKKLREDALGETFRAGKVGRDGIEQVVLLRVLNGQGMDGERLWQRVSSRTTVQQALRSPNIGTGVDLGKVRSYPYAAYDYISGKNLATLFAQAARLRQPLPADHALLIAERLALALAAAYETRVQDERVLHGFVVPHLAMISNEGETRLLGFEVAPGLRELWAAGWRDEDLRGYLAPEATASAAPVKSDDVYSLGVILFELLSGERLPAAAAGSYATAIDEMVLPNDGTQLPAGIAALLKKSLVPREQRIPDAITWHKAVAQLMIEGHYSSTTFNLAFFMHSLFRDEIDRENQEIESEKKLELPRPAAVPVAAAAAAAAAGAAPRPGGAGGDMRERTGVRDAAWAAGGAGAGAAAAAPNRTPLWIGLAAVVVAALAGGAFFAFGRSAKPPAPLPVAQPAPAAAAPSPEEAAKNAAALQAQIQQMFEARSKDMESKLKGQYDDQIHQLQQKLDESRRAAAGESERDRSRTERAAAAAAPAAESAPSPTPAHTESPAATHAAAVTPPPSPAAREAAVPPPTSAASVAPPPAAAPVAAAPAASQPQIQTGDLVQAGPGVVGPKITFRPEVRYPAAARRMNKSAEVMVKVLVDERGRVQQVSLSGAAVGLGFDEAALDVARRSNYVAATKDGVRVKMWTVMKITFVPPI